jgi:hypothetical protein
MILGSNGTIKKEGKLSLSKGRRIEVAIRTMMRRSYNASGAAARVSPLVMAVRHFEPTTKIPEWTIPTGVKKPTMTPSSQSVVPDPSGPWPPPIDGPVPAGKGPDNKPGVYAKAPAQAYWQKSRKNVVENPTHMVDNILVPEFVDDQHPMSERPPSNSGISPMGHRYFDYEREGPQETVIGEQANHMQPWHDHHPDYDYRNITGKAEGNKQFLQGIIGNMHMKKATLSLYKQILRGLPLVKHSYLINMTLPQMRLTMRERFEQNRHIEDPDAIRHLIHNGWMEYIDSITARRLRNSVMKFFCDDHSQESLFNKYVVEERQMNDERKWWSGGAQRREGAYEGGHWSWLGAQCEKEFDRLAGRVPRSWTAAKGYFEQMKPDGTNFWEKSLDYEGWYLTSHDPDRNTARKEYQGYIESGYNQPRHYASKNRRAWRRAVKEVDFIMQCSLEDVYLKNREQMFQYNLREKHPESNRIHAERSMARQDDEFYSCNFTEYEQYVKQAMREMPNPRLWRTDAFYFRLRYLASALEYNWAKVPIGAKQERLFNEWVSDNGNYAVLNSPQFAAVKKNKKQNPMAWTMADFYTAFDPDVPETRKLPWYHPEFNYDRRYKWDERCMRMKRWVDSGNIEGKLPYFEGHVAEWEQFVNRNDLMHRADSPERRYASPRMVQLYRALGRMMDVALANQMRAFARVPLDVPSDAEAQKILDKTDFSAFVFKVPVVIYPDGVSQPILGLDGSPCGEVASETTSAPPASATVTA